MLTTGEQQGGACVAQIVEPDIWQTGPLEERLERGRCEAAEVQRLATVGAKDQSVILPHSPESEPLGVLGGLVDPKRLDGLAEYNVRHVKVGDTCGIVRLGARGGSAGRITEDVLQPCSGGRAGRGGGRFGRRRRGGGAVIVGSLDVCPTAARSGNAPTSQAAAVTRERSADSLREVSTRHAYPRWALPSPI